MYVCVCVCVCECVYVCVDVCVMPTKDRLFHTVIVTNNGEHQNCHYDQFCWPSVIPGSTRMCRIKMGYNNCYHTQCYYSPISDNARIGKTRQVLLTASPG